MNRFLPDEPLPPYSYVPNRFPHPFSDPDGHGFYNEPQLSETPVPENWITCRPFLLGIDLFNLGYYWEAHEVWEGIWHSCGRRGATADFFKGLIKLAAAGVKLREQRPAGMISHAKRAAELFELVRNALDEDTYFGLSLRELRNTAEQIIQPFTPSDSDVGLMLPLKIEL